MGDLLKSTFALTPKNKASGRLRRFIREPGVWVDKWWVGGESHYTWLKDPIEISPTEVTVSIRDDARWSDGQNVTGKDIALYPLLHSLRRRSPSYYAADQPIRSVSIWGAFDDFDISDRSVTYRSSPGHFDRYWESTIRTRFGLWGLQVDTHIPTHKEPYGTFADAVIETVRKAQAGEINPWEGYDNQRSHSQDPHRASLVKKYLDKGGKYVSKFSKPEHVLSTGAWSLVDLSGPEAVFKKNEHHRNADAINFDTFTLEYSPSDQRERAALKADRFDYAEPGPTPQSVVESLPDNITQLLVPGNLYTGNELGLDFSHSGLDIRSVRAAIMYALNHTAITDNIHPTTAKPVTTPGGDCWDATDYVSNEWIEKNLITYSKNQKRAANLLRAAGYSRDGGRWLTADGEPLSLKLATPESTPRWEPTVARQLSQFGIQTSVSTLSGPTFSSRVKNGEFPLRSHWGVATNQADATLQFWFGPIQNRTKYSIYPQEQFKTGDFSAYGTPIPRTEDRWRAFSIKAPPIGQRNGPLTDYHPSSLALAYVNNPPQEEFQRRVKTTMWLANWFLPTIPINKTMQQHFVDDAHWQWPTNTPIWKTFTNAGPQTREGIFASGTIRANPDNPER